MLLTKSLDTPDGRRIIIRRAVQSDIPGIIDCFNDVMREEIYLLGDYYTGSEEFLSIRIEDQTNEIILVAEHEGNIIGVLTLTRESFRKNYHVAVLGIAIRNGFRHLGIGTALMNFSFEWAKENGIEKICLEVFSTNHNAISLYKKLGFEIEGIKKKQFKIRGEYVDDILMAKFL